MSLGKSALTRLFLLIVLAFGVACMHTLGHNGFSGHNQAIAASHDMAASMPFDAQTSVGDGSPSPMTGMNPFAVCLAILGLTVLIVVMLLWGSAERAFAVIGRLRVTLAASGRGPPGRTLIGLRLADLSVMRT